MIKKKIKEKYWIKYAKEKENVTWKVELIVGRREETGKRRGPSEDGFRFLPNEIKSKQSSDFLFLG